ncbi:hypothetical protein [Filifactor alocis]|nr:hypothetical protein [Filifactor alocis]
MKREIEPIWKWMKSVVLLFGKRIGRMEDTESTIKHSKIKRINKKRVI